MSNPALPLPDDHLPQNDAEMNRDKPITGREEHEPTCIVAKDIRHGITRPKRMRHHADHFGLLATDTTKNPVSSLNNM